MLKNKPTFNRSWVPVRRGAVFCSPACGGDCKYAAHLDAHTNAKALCATLDRTTKMKGWKKHVWENLGWHYSAISPCGRIKVHANRWNRRVSYTAFLGEPGCGGGRWAESGKTAPSSVRNVIAKAKAEEAKIGATIEGL